MKSVKGRLVKRGALTEVGCELVFARRSALLHSQRITNWSDILPICGALRAGRDPWI